MNDEYLTIADDKIGEGYYTEKRSKFLAFSHHVSTTDEIKALIGFYKTKYYDSRHVCYAYVLGADRTVFRANDDGEPSGTAGRPILQVLEKQNLYNVVLVVVRYFGGIKLGAGGLLRAYTSTATSCLENSQKITYYKSNICKIKLDYSKYQSFLKQIENRFVVITNTNFENGAEIDFIAREDEKIDNAQILGNTMCCFPNMSNKG